MADASPCFVDCYGNNSCYYNGKFVRLNRQVRTVSVVGAGSGDFPSASQLAALRAWYAGLPACAEVVQYLGESRATGQSSRALLG